MTETSSALRTVKKKASELEKGGDNSTAERAATRQYVKPENVLRGLQLLDSRQGTA